MTGKKHLKYVAHGGRTGLGVVNSLAGINEVYSKITYFKFQAHVT